LNFHILPILDQVGFMLCGVVLIHGTNLIFCFVTLSGSLGHMLYFVVQCCLDHNNQFYVQYFYTLTEQIKIFFESIQLEKCGDNQDNMI